MEIKLMKSFDGVTALTKRLFTEKVTSEMNADMTCLTFYSGENKIKQFPAPHSITEFYCGENLEAIFNRATAPEAYDKFCWWFINGVLNGEFL